MPEVYNNIYIETGVGSLGDTTYTKVTEFVTATDDKIGNYQLPTLYTIPNTLLGGIDVMDTYFSISDATLSGIDTFIATLNLDTTTSGIYTKIVNFYRGYSYDNLKNLPVEYDAGSTKVTSVKDLHIDFINGEHFNIDKDIWVAFWISLYNYFGYTDIATEYSVFTSISGISTIPVDFNAYTSYSGSLNKVVDLSFSGWILNNIYSDIINTSMSTDNFLTDSEVIDGGLLRLNLDLHSTIQTINTIYYDILCCLTSYADISFESTTISGGVDRLSFDSFCALSGTNCIESDINLFPIKIYNFSIDSGGYTTDTYISVDVEDDVYGITTSGTYFLLNDVIVPITFSGIADGYRMYYALDDIFYDNDGPIVFTAHAENNNGDMLEIDYYLTFGYIVEYKNSDPWYDLNKKVIVRMTAENYATCNKESTYAYWFETQDYKRNDLMASINVIRQADKDLTASIYPQSLAYFYGRTFDIKLTAKDFNGNEMIPLEYSFTIEDKP